MNTHERLSLKHISVLSIATLLILMFSKPVFSQQNIAQVPLFLTNAVPGVVMINMSVDSQLFFSAFPDSADLSNDGSPDQGYIHDVDYFGYFDPYKCYRYSSSNRFTPVSNTSDKYCSGSNWSGNFLNWLTMARIDTVRKILYGGKRHIDTPSLTVLERTYLPNDAHSWVKYYDGDDLNKLSPYESDSPTTSSVTGSHSIVSGSRRGSNDRFFIETPEWTSSSAYNGDQIKMTSANDSDVWMKGVIITTELASPPRRVEVQITGSSNPSGTSNSLDDWQITNRSRQGISFCNTTVTTGASHGSTALSAPPLLKVARGNYSLWTANERWQCRWREDVSPNVPNRMRIHDRSFANGNDVVSSGLWSNADMPRRGQVRLDEFDVRVEVCVDGLVGTENCRENGADQVLKPVGLLQEFSTDDELHFGLFTGSFTNHVSGGVLRKNVVSFADEVDPNTGIFTLPTDSIVRSIDALRIYGYSHNSGEYTAGADNCVFGSSKTQMINGRCFSWGNPQAEIYAESLRYFAGLEPTSSFLHTGNDRITNLSAATWNNPITEETWCTPKSIIQFNASVTSFDDDAPSVASDLPNIQSLNQWTNTVGTGEGLANSKVFMGGSSGFCDAESISNLSDFSGICPEAPNQDGTYHIAGLAHYAYTNDLRPDWTGEQTVRTYGVSLAPAVPRIEVPLPGGTSPAVVILPACDNKGDDLRCALADFQVIEQDNEAGTGRFFIQWDVAEWGADFDMDVSGSLSYVINGNEISITTQVWADSSGRETGFGYIISGTGNDGFHAHSGINNYTRTNPGSNVPNCNNCRVGDPPTVATFTVGGGTDILLPEPLKYAAKWGGFDKELDQWRKDNQLSHFPDYAPTWEDPNRPGLPTNYFFAVNPAELLSGLEAALSDFVGRIESSATAAAVSSSVVEEDTRAFFAGFRSTDWSGTLTSRPIDRNGNVSPEGCAECWNAEETLIQKASSGTRKIFTRSNTSPSLGGIGDGIPFNWSSLTTEQRASLNHSPAGINDNLGEDRLSWMKGQDFTGFRSRQTTDGLRLLGAIISSDPVYHNDVVYVGTNGGMLHAFDGDTGEELFAFIPSKLLLPENGNNFAPVTRLMEEDFVDNHRYFVDGKIEVRTVLHDNERRTILVGSLGAGGKQVFALDVTNPDDFTEQDVLWEFAHPELGASIGTPQIARIQPNGNWGVLFGNGYNSNSLQSSLFILDLFTGNIIEHLSTGEGSTSSPNGLATPFVTDWPNGGFRADRVYAGDLLGNLWVFDLSRTNTQQWSHRLLGKAEDPDGVTQPITTKPIGQVLSNEQVMISFGTGSFIFSPDASDDQVQSLYGFTDTITPRVLPIERDDLVNQSIIFETLVQTASGSRNVRVISNNQVNLAEKQGWVLDLDWSDGERVISNPRTLGRNEKRVRFSTLIPDNDVCGTGRSGFFYDLNLRTGGRLEQPVFDLDGDSQFGEGDLIAVPDLGFLPPSGIQLGQGEQVTSVVTTDDQDERTQIICDGQGNCERVRDSDQDLGRMTWQQLR